LGIDTLRAVFNAVGAWIERRCDGQLPLLAGRIVRVLDGTGLTMPDSLQKMALCKQPKNRLRLPGHQTGRTVLPAHRQDDKLMLGSRQIS
jgi:hypothetical protein